MMLLETLSDVHVHEGIVVWVSVILKTDQDCVANLTCGDVAYVYVCVCVFVCVCMCAFFDTISAQFIHGQACYVLDMIHIKMNT
jgi:hypothetical protein